MFKQVPKRRPRDFANVSAVIDYNVEPIGRPLRPDAVQE